MGLSNRTKKKCVLKRLKENFIKTLRLYTTKKGV